MREQLAQHEAIPATTATLRTTDAASPANFATLSLGFAVVALIVAIVVGWGFPIGVGAVALGVMSLRGRVESRPIAAWGVALGALSLSTARDGSCTPASNRGGSADSHPEGTLSVPSGLIGSQTWGSSGDESTLWS
ncbi:hypothetical protein [Microbacterium sp. RG1]|uniref:hypothetical protein n=1 Tax=Microbacterium sp. RG1 TaxID=2489212 RepID=UPI0010CA2048|nr:hypothetical protein [Microbacterium sp. RG1]QCQ18041.1 hypothetical protein EHF32_15665 [Microbacterium sp. RG1]